MGDGSALSGSAGQAGEGGERLRWVAPVALLLAAAMLRFWGAFDISGYTGDESLHVPSAINLLRDGVQDTANWTHPPIGALFLGWTISLFGDAPVGWRIGGILFGSASVLLLYLVTLRLTRSARAASLAAALLAFDPFHVYYSRSTFMEVPVVAFFLLFLWAILVFHEDRTPWSLPLAGLAMGLTAATKSYFALSTVLVIGVALAADWRRREERLQLALEAICWLVLLPAAVFLAAYGHFFARGHTLSEFVQMNGDALWTLSVLAAESFEDPWLLQMGGQPWEWFVRPIAFGVKLGGDAGGGRYLLELNNFPVRLVALAAVAYLAVRGVRERSVPLLASPVLFASVYSLFFVLSRPMLSYSALAVLPFAYLALAVAAVLLERRHPRLRRLSVVAIAAVALWGCYLYPLATAKPVDDAFYRAIVSGPGVMVMGQ